ncbi:MAG: HNH endonuclease [Methylococcaceae bacterium]|nr:MAG: HNH endonuclease [Methylococcaceae bacterium]
MQSRTGWSRDQLLVAFYLYCRMPFGKMHRGNPDIVRFAGLIDRTPSALAMKLTNIASLDPAITSTGRKGLEGASAADRAMWDEMQRDWANFALETQNAVRQIEGGVIELCNVEPYIQSDAEDYEGGEKLVATKVRVGQSFFRSAVLSAYGFRCCISELAVPQFLIASHIIPWRVDARNRINPKNGLCLSVLHDKAFDSGLIGITADMTVMVSPKLKAFNDRFITETIIQFDGRPLRLPEKFFPSQEFLAYHREVIFQDTA